MDDDYWGENEKKKKDARNFFDEEEFPVGVKNESEEIDFDRRDVVGRLDDDGFMFDWKRSASEAQSARVTVKRRETKPVEKPAAKSARDLEKQVKSLQTQLDEADRSRFKALSIEDTLRRMLLGEPYCLEFYKSLEQKLDLLAKAIEYGDGNCIVAVLLFLKRTLAYKLFFSALITHADAENHYLAYLKQRGDLGLEELEKTYNRLARPEDEWMMKYEQCKEIGSVKSQLWHLKDCQRTLTEPEFKPVAFVYGEMAKEHVELLGRQIEIDKKDDELARRGTYHLFNSHPRKSLLASQPLMTTLFYCSFYHWEAGEDSIKSPVKLKADFKLSEKQYLYAALAARTKRKKWDEVEKLLTTKGWFRTNKWTTAIGMDVVVDILYRYSATRDVIEKYVKIIDDLELRFKMAAKVKSYGVAVDTLISLRDRNQLLKFRENVPPVQRAVHEKIERSLTDPSVRWK
ncbi:spermatogenesis-defective protein 39 homolog isoform X2 [Oscarella lobularis]|uniref:spermatogenesis-defective protein 39 homolog isoform X2 n=1 Tax=Oscarella lobularis TaxID=121494 RepID=UPI003313A8A6